jgi:hypothetical protein
MMMKKMIALFTAMAFALTLGVAFAQEKAAAPAAEPEKKVEEKAPAKKKAAKKKAAKKKAAKKEEAAAPAAPAASAVAPGPCSPGNKVVSPMPPIHLFHGGEKVILNAVTGS